MAQAVAIDGGPARAKVRNPLGVAVSPKGDRIYATQSGGARSTIVLDRSGQPIGELVPPNTVPGGRLPLYMAVDASGSVYISDRLRKLGAGWYIVAFGSSPNPIQHRYQDYRYR